MFINIYRNPKTRNWFMYETFIHLFEFKGFSTWGERETQSFYADCFYIVSSQPNQRAASVAHKVVWPRPALSRSVAGTQLTDFFQISKSSTHASGAWRHSHPLVSIPTWDFYFDTSSQRVNTCVNVAPNPCTKRKVLMLTKPKGKIYKTKSLRNYITKRIGSILSWDPQKWSFATKCSKIYL